MSREIMQQAVFALDELIYDFPDDGDVDTLANAKAVMKSLEAALAQPEQSKYSDIVSDGGLDPRNKFDAQPEQEPVAWMQDSIELYANDRPTEIYKIPLYTAPPRKPWVGLTDDERTRYIKYTAENFAAGVLWAEAKLKERNCG